LGCTLQSDKKLLYPCTFYDYYYPLTSSAPDGGCKYIYHSQIKIWVKPIILNLHPKYLSHFWKQPEDDSPMMLASTQETRPN
jgi:hypothetical protein